MSFRDRLEGETDEIEGNLRAEGSLIGRVGHQDISTLVHTSTLVQQSYKNYLHSRFGTPS